MTIGASWYDRKTDNCDSVNDPARIYWTFKIDLRSSNFFLKILLHICLLIYNFYTIVYRADNLICRHKIKNIIIVIIIFRNVEIIYI